MSNSSKSSFRLLILKKVGALDFKFKSRANEENISHVIMKKPNVFIKTFEKIGFLTKIVMFSWRAALDDASVVRVVCLFLVFLILWSDDGTKINKPYLPSMSLISGIKRYAKIPKNDIWYTWFKCWNKGSVIVKSLLISSVKMFHSC